MKLKILVNSLALQQIKEVGVVTKQKGISLNIECTCKNTVVHYFYVKFFKFEISAVCHYEIKKIKTV